MPDPSRTHAAGSGGPLGSGSPLRRPLGKGRRAARRTLRAGARLAETLLAALWRRLLVRTTVIAVVGSLGKTTTRELLHAALAGEGPILRTAKNENSGPGPRRTLLRLRPWHRHGVIELGIGAPGQMIRLGRLVRPDVVVLTNVARCHLDSFRTLDAVLAEKASIVECLPRGGLVVTNDACPEIAALALPESLRRVRFVGARPPEPPPETPSEAVPARGTAEIACRLLAARSRWPEPLTVTLEHADAGRLDYVTRLHGEHWANAIGAAATTARALGVAHETIVAALATVPNWERRLEPVTLAERGAVYVRDDYNGSIDTYRASLAWFGRARARRRIVLHGRASDASNTGGNRKAQQRLSSLVAAGTDHAAAITPYPHTVRDACARAGLGEQSVTTLSGVHDAIAWCRATLGEGDLLLCKGRGEEKLERVYLGLFGEVVCRRERCRYRKGCDGCPELGFAVTPAMREGSAPVLPARA